MKISSLTAIAVSVLRFVVCARKENAKRLNYIYKTFVKCFDRVCMQTLLKHCFNGHDKNFINICYKHSSNIYGEQFVSVYKCFNTIWVVFFGAKVLEPDVGGCCLYPRQKTPMGSQTGGRSYCVGGGHALAAENKEVEDGLLTSFTSMNAVTCWISLWLERKVASLVAIA